MKEGDVWALGITIYALIFKKLPFYDKKVINLYKLI